MDGQKGIFVATDGRTSIGMRTNVPAMFPTEGGLPARCRAGEEQDIPTRWERALSAAWRYSPALPLPSVQKLSDGKAGSTPVLQNQLQITPLTPVALMLTHT